MVCCLYYSRLCYLFVSTSCTLYVVSFLSLLTFCSSSPTCSHWLPSRHHTFPASSDTLDFVTFLFQRISSTSVVTNHSASIYLIVSTFFRLTVTFLSLLPFLFLLTCFAPLFSDSTNLLYSTLFCSTNLLCSALFCFYLPALLHPLLFLLTCFAVPFSVLLTCFASPFSVSTNLLCFTLSVSTNLVVPPFSVSTNLLCSTLFGFH